MLSQVTDFLLDVGTKVFNSLLSDWGIIGIGLIATFLINRVVNFVKKFFI